MKTKQQSFSSRIIGIFTAGMMILQSIPASVPVSAAEGSCGPSASWSMSGDTLVIKGSGDVNSTSWAAQKLNIKNVVIENGITSLPGYAFDSYPYLENLKMADSVTTLGMFFCNSCSELTSVTFSQGLTEIPMYAFNGCRSIKQLSLPKRLTSIGANAFYGNISLTALEIPDGVTNIDSRAFYGNNVKTLSLGSSLKTLGSDAFNFSCFKEVTIPATIESIGKNAIFSYYELVEYAQGKLTGSYTNQPGTTTIYGEPGSAAETYAKETKLNFLPIGATNHTHSWSDWKDEKAATCLVSGTQIRTCSGCSEKEIRTVEATGHAWGAWKANPPATCTTDGMNERICANCHEKESHVTEAVGHSWSSWNITKQPTITEEGSREHTCLKCNQKETEVMPKTESYTVHISCSQGGTVTPNDNQTVPSGSSITIRIQPDNGYRLQSIVVNGETVGTSVSYTIQNITENKEVSVTFEKIPLSETRYCAQVTVNPKKSFWYTDETAFSIYDFEISATISNIGTIQTNNIISYCKIDTTPMALSENKNGSYHLPIIYTGSDKDIKAYAEENPIYVTIPMYVRGDVTQDDIISSLDAMAALQIYLDSIIEKPSSDFTEMQMTLANVDNKGNVTLDDAMYILMYYAETLNGNTPNWKTILAS